MILVLAMGSEYDQIIFRQASELTTTWSCFDSLSETGFTGFLDVFSVNMKSSVVDLCCAHQVLLLAHFIQGVPEITIWELRTRLSSFVFPLAFRCHYWVISRVPTTYVSWRCACADCSGSCMFSHRLCRCAGFPRCASQRAASCFLALAAPLLSSRKLGRSTIHPLVCKDKDMSWESGISEIRERLNNGNVLRSPQKI